MDLLCRLELASKSGLGQDVFTNSLVITDLDGDLYDGDFPEIASLVAEALFNDIPTGGLAALATVMSGEIDRTADACRVKLYDLTGHLGGSDVGSPVADETWTMGPRTEVAGNPDLPAEVACAVTLEGLGRTTAAVETADGADAGSERDRPKQRRTGRIYVGPLNGLALAVVDGQTRPSSYIRDTARLAVTEVNSQLESVYDAGLGVWSRKDGVVRLLHAVSVDNAFDVIRSRGPEATARYRSLV